MASLDFRLQKIDETKNYLLEEVKHNEILSKKQKKTRRYLNYTKNLLILVSTVPGCVSVFTFASLVGVPLAITSSAVTIKACVTTAGIKVNY